jgi:surface antigen
MNNRQKLIFRSKRSLYITVLLSSIVFLSGCLNELSKSDSGTGIGAVLGGVLGSQIGNNKTTGILIGAAVGGLVGRIIGKYMDDNDRQKVAQSLDESPSGKTTAWTNQKTGNKYELTPGDNYVSSEGNKCREFEQEVIVNGKREKVNGTACKEPESEQWDMT